MSADDSKIRELTDKKWEIHAQIRELQAKALEVDRELNRAGAEASLVAFW